MNNKKEYNVIERYATREKGFYIDIIQYTSGAWEGRYSFIDSAGHLSIFIFDSLRKLKQYLNKEYRE